MLDDDEFNPLICSQGPGNDEEQLVGGEDQPPVMAEEDCRDPAAQATALVLWRADWRPSVVRGDLLVVRCRMLARSSLLLGNLEIFILILRLHAGPQVWRVARRRDWAWCISISSSGSGSSPGGSTVQELGISCSRTGLIIRCWIEASAAGNWSVSPAMTNTFSNSLGSSTSILRIFLSTFIVK